MEPREEKKRSDDDRAIHERDFERDDVPHEEEDAILEEIAIEEVGIDGMCGVY